ncbi:hypothetical protein WICPIJ_004491 [Wickerhamomyces pijperi]|uniref:Uncharacterized protein n=1 Tax=Wickerhamomyces pijperi TaxID=599730 RepID=A0A9P8TMQ4_WICPI|nr:hypothetical protein WICPIJ_004491 [Wickerhamomyces pijperi]
MSDTLIRLSNLLKSVQISLYTWFISWLLPHSLTNVSVSGSMDGGVGSSSDLTLTKQGSGLQGMAPFITVVSASKVVKTPQIRLLRFLASGLLFSK